METGTDIEAKMGDVEAGEGSDIALDTAVKDININLVDTLANDDVVIVGKSTCGFCTEAVRALQDLGVSPTIILVDKMKTGGSALRKEAATLSGHPTVPMIWISGKFIGGCHELKELIASGAIYKSFDNFKVAPAAGGGNAAAEAAAASAAVAIYPSKEAARTLPFYYPETNDDHVVYWGARLMCVLSAFIVGFGDRGVIGWVTLGFLCDFCLRLFGGAGCSPIGALSLCLNTLFRRWKEPKFLSAASKQFAALCGVSFVAIATGGFLGGYPEVGRAFMAAMVVLNATQGFLAWCLGCWFFAMGVELGLIPASIHRLHLQLLHEKRYTWRFTHTYTTDRRAPPSVTQRTPGLPANPTDLTSKKRSDKDKWQRNNPVKFAAELAAPLTDKWQWFNPVKYAAVTHFAAPLTVVSAGVPWLYLGYDTVSEVVAWVGIAMFAVLFLLFAAKTIRFPRKTRKELAHPQKAAAFALIPITLTVFAAQMRQHATLSDVAFWGGAVLSCGCASMHLASLVAHPWSADAVDAMWLVPALSSVISAQLISSSSLSAFGRYMLAYGIVAYLALWPMTLHKVITMFNDDFRSRYGVAILACCPAAIGLAIKALESAADAVFSPILACCLAAIGVAVRAARWPLSSCIAILACCPAAIGLAIKALESAAADAVFEYCFLASVGLTTAVLVAAYPFNFFREGKFQMSAWALGFPLNLVATAAVVYDAAIESRSTQFLSIFFVGAGGMASATLLLNMLNSLLNGGVFVPLQKWGPFSFWQMVHEAVRHEATELAEQLTRVGGPGSQSLSNFCARLDRLCYNIDIHATQEDTVMFPILALYFPGLQESSVAQHQEEHQRHGDFMAALKALGDAATLDEGDRLLADVRAQGAGVVGQRKSVSNAICRCFVAALKALDDAATLDEGDRLLADVRAQGTG
ncbi:voltage-dependent anion channel-domain-containing protein [Tribonema minus]|uniref:Voltage-dependent anion channel-domain-containing protein n=1 Tax=Tribonema minus TaxID=303371 RepID=A0A836CB11_9STRA|nr:voltage-dependent anion channel-domain-containing protein [Tribonema minus]